MSGRMPEAGPRRRSAPGGPGASGTRPGAPSGPDVPSGRREAQLQRRRAGRRRRILPWLVLGLCAAAIGILVVAGLMLPRILSAEAAPPPTIIDPDTGKRVPMLSEPSPGQTASATPPPRPLAPVAGQPLHLRLPAIGLDVNVGSMTVPAGGSVDPPTMGSAYWLRGYGTAGAASDNTAYIAAHTCRGACHAAFSPMLDIPQSQTLVHPGDEVLVTTPQGVDHYTVTDTQLYTKATIQSQDELWKKVPGRLVLVTCFQYAGGTSSQQNFVVYAQLDTRQP
ncbi:MAG TPA: sortase [Gryllotalpicola sp.]